MKQVSLSGFLERVVLAILIRQCGRDVLGSLIKPLVTLLGRLCFPLRCILFHEVGPGYPCVCNQGSNDPSLSGVLGGVPGIARSLRITVAIETMEWGTETMADPLYPALLRRDVK